MPPEAVAVSSPSPLTHLNEDEQLFRSSVREFSQQTIGPLVRQMDEEQHFSADLLPQLFQLGLMGIEIPVEYGGAGGSFFEASLAVEEISAVDPSVGVLVDVQNTLCVNALLRWGTEEQKKRFLSRLRLERGGFGVRCLRAPVASREARQRIRAQWPEALDHQRPRG
jgi:butyryl-CoA dehydrogenase/short/branched chain acyl-CoA dehydrogenase